MAYEDVRVNDRIEVGEVSDDLYDARGPLAERGDKGTVLAVYPDNDPAYSTYDVMLDQGFAVTLIGYEFTVLDRPANDPSCHERALL